MYLSSDEEQFNVPDREDPDFEYQLTLERRRQQLQKELEQMEMEENQSDRDVSQPHTYFTFHSCKGYYNV